MTLATGILGGTFDPVHNGHLELADQVVELCNLDEVIFVPSASPPHKADRIITPFHHRLEMLKIAVAERRQFVISEVEKLMPAPTYTIDMLSCLPDEEIADKKYHFVIGVDAFLEISSWKKYAEVLKKVHFIVSARPGFNNNDLQKCIESLGYDKLNDHWYNELTGKWIYYLNIKIADISSSEIRKMIGNGSLMTNVVPSAVQRYIQENNLYSP